MAKRSRKRKTGAQSSSTSDSGSIDLSEEYKYVIEDLERIGIIAVILIAALIAGRIVMNLV